MEDEESRAKKLFLSYHGSHSRMYREGDLDEYKGYNIPREVEIEWCEEFVMKHAKELSIRNWDAALNLEALSRNFQDSSILEKIVSFAARNTMSADSLVKLMYAESMIRIIQACKKAISRDQLFEACKVTVLLLESIMSGPLVLDPGHELSQASITDKKALNSRALKGINEIRGLLN
ncbi:hypothetical protein FE782_09600 [Paenibacillus antri]|uniref:Uncharacterized protein n=1 Tax=Paenibacillus antri TaxID=2582848 RepID=A0A5R9G906_9BACL|nr:hypothetical protein [Paenibacillus antri]TLS52221.1 hypothetical protein FE782_09600 [Paenibacillus antri]